MKLELSYLTKLSTLAGGLARLNEGNPFSTDGAFGRIHFDQYVNRLKESPEKFVEAWWKNREADPDAREMAADLRDAVKPHTTSADCAAALRVLADAAYDEAVKLQEKAIEGMIPQGIGPVITRSSRYESIH